MRPDDIAKLIGVNRATASLWVNGHSQPHRLLSGKVKKLLAAIRAAAHAGKLPVPLDVVSRERHLYLNTALVPHLRAAAAPTA